MDLTPQLSLLCALLTTVIQISSSFAFRHADDATFHDQVVFTSSAIYEPAPLPVANPTKGFWTHSAPDANVLAGEGSEGALTKEADVCIIGSGITGVSAAYHLVEGLKEREAESERVGEGLDIVILEARDFCSGATGRNGGHLAHDIFENFRSRIASFGLNEAIRAIQIETYTANSLASIVHEHGLQDAVDLVEGGRILLASDETWMDERRLDWEEVLTRRADVDSVEWFTEAEMNEIYGTSHGSGVKIPGRNLWPLKLVTQLYKLANDSIPATSSLKLHTRTPVTDVSPISSSSSTAARHPRRWQLSTPRGHISCSSVLHATNAYASHLLPQFAGPEGIVPTRGQVIATRSNATVEQLTTSGWVGNQGYEYWFPRPVKESDTEQHPLVILGGGRDHEDGKYEFGSADDSVIDPSVGKALREFLPSTFPSMFVEGNEPEMEWTGIMGFTKIGDPFVGPVLTPDDADEVILQVGQYIAAGFSGHGMPRGFGCAQVSAGLLLAELTNTTYEYPEWFPRHYLMENRL